MRHLMRNPRQTLSTLLARPLGRLLIVVLMFASMGAGFYGFKALHKPGPVSAMALHGKSIKGYDSHASFEKECSHCHAPIHCITATRCQDCHMEVAQQREQGVGLHGLLPGTDKCQNCHVEHQGREAVISEFALSNVDHAQLTGFSLDRHAVDYQDEPLVCNDCHAEHSFQPGAVDCASCHREQDAAFIDEHMALVGADCASCHDGQDRLAEFDHNAVFALDGAHANADCVDCHADQVFAGRSSDCVACHEQPDIHSDRFGTQCDRCHTTTAWLPARLLRHTFCLTHGEEQQIPCATCHTGSYTQYPCYACHDREETRLAHRDREVLAIDNCIDCHPTGTRDEAIKISAAAIQGDGS